MTPVSDRIRSLEARLHVGPLIRPWGSEVRELHVIEVRVALDDGRTGTGMSWTPTVGAQAVLALLRHDIRDRVLGRRADPIELWPTLWAELHEAGSGGLTTIALAGLDTALWDLRADERGLVDELGRRRDSAPVYGSGVNLHYPLDELLAQTRRWIDAGFSAVKIKVGHAELAEDVDRVAAVRELLGPDRRLMVDANQRWTLPVAERALDALARFDLAWIEEPLRADDTAGHAALRTATEVPVALGENAHTWWRFRDLLDAGALDIAQPNVVRVGGVTPFLRIAELVRERGAVLAPHLLPELSGQLALTTPEECWVEEVEDAGLHRLGVLTDPVVRIDRARLTVPPHRGLGLRFTHSAPDPQEDPRV